MVFVINTTQVQAILKTNRDAASWQPILADMLPKYKIDTVFRVAGFMAQCAHESSDFRNLEENLNYSADRLVQVFPRYFGPGRANPAEYARNPEKLANYVYMDVNRSKSGALGNTQPGDGWRFRGGGIKQLTGRTNFTAFGKGIGMAPEQAADHVRTRQGALESACWFWSINNLNQFADSRDIVAMTRRINGGTIGLEDRTDRWHSAIQILNTVSAAPVNTTVDATELRRGSKGERVKILQKALGLSADGDFGPATQAAVIKWQVENKHRPTGIVDFNTFNAITV